MNEREDLKAYLDRELAPERMAEMADVIARDPGLAREAEELQQLSAAIRANEMEVPVVGMEETLRALQKRSSRPKWVIQLPIWVATAAALAVLWVPMRNSMTAANSVAMEQVDRSTFGAATAMESAKSVQSTKSVEAVPSQSKSTGDARSVRSQTKGALTPGASSAPAPVKERATLRFRSEAAGAASLGNEPSSGTKSAPTEAPQAASPVPVMTGAGRAALDKAEDAVDAPVVVEVQATDLIAAEIAVSRLALEMGGEVLPPEDRSKRAARSALSERAKVPVTDRQVEINLTVDSVATFQKRVADVAKDATVNQSQMFAAQPLNQAQGGVQAGGYSGQSQLPGGGKSNSEADTKASKMQGRGGSSRDQRIESKSDPAAKSPRKRVVVIIRLKDDKPVAP